MSDPTSIKTPSEVGGLLNRSQGYRLLGLLLRHPGRRDEKERLESPMKTYQKTLDDLPWKEQLGEQVERLAQLYAGTSIEEWTRDHEYCFGHTAHSRVSPYELEYGEEHSHREPQELADITAFYQAFHLQVSKTSRERSDHISVECEFMHFLTFKTAYALRRGEREHAAICAESAFRFFSTHPAHWMPAFAVRLSRTAESDWMKVVADFCLRFIVTECGIFGIESGDPNMSLRMIDKRVETSCVSCPLSASSVEGESRA